MPTTEVNIRRCQSRSRYGCCGRIQKHPGAHAVPIGGGVWFGYRKGGVSLGYGYLRGDDFVVKPLSGWPDENGADQ